MRSKVNSSNRLTLDSFLLISYKILMIIFFVSGQVKFNFGDFERKYIQYTLNSRKKEFILKKKNLLCSTQLWKFQVQQVPESFCRMCRVFETFPDN